jgi:hypothetical protein
LNCTAPVGVPAVEVTVAVSVKLWPKAAGFAEVETAVTLPAFTIWNERATLEAAL